MKQILFTLLLAAFAVTASAQVPSVSIKNIDGKTVDTASLGKAGHPVIISFWATWCSPCKRELNTYMEYLEEWTEEYGVELVAVSIDDQRTTARVAPYVNSSEWECTVLLDSNSDFKRAMQVNNVPHTFLIDADGNIVWQHNNYSDGDEEELIAELEKLR